LKLSPTALLTLLMTSPFLFVSNFAQARSWTGKMSFYQAPTSTGCAHRFLPFGTKLKVTNLENGRQTVLTVRDRGPFIRGRIIDVSLHAADVLGLKHTGVAPVRIETVSSQTAMN